VKAPAGRVSGALIAFAPAEEAISGSEQGGLLPGRQGVRYRAQPHPGVFEGDHRGHGTTAESGNVVDHSSVAPARRPSRTDLGRAPTRHGPF
jgi:hypothetical protein